MIVYNFIIKERAKIILTILKKTGNENQTFFFFGWKQFLFVYGDLIIFFIFVGTKKTLKFSSSFIFSTVSLLFIPLSINYSIMSTTTKPASAVKKSYPFYFGGAASCVAAVVVHPFDLTKVRLQNTKGSMNQSMFSTMVKIAQNEGFFKLYAGLSASILRQATYSTVRFGVYEKLKDYIQSTTQQSKF